MQSFRISPPWEFLLSASRNSLQSYGLSRLSRAANLRKEISALLARWLMEHRERESAIVEPADAAPQKSIASVMATLYFIRISNILYSYIYKAAIGRVEFCGNN